MEEIAMTNNQGTKKCPYCAEDIKSEAVKCKHCGSMLDSSSPRSQSNEVKGQPTGAEIVLQYEGRKKSGALAAVLNLLLPGAGYFYCGRHTLGLIVFILFVVIPVAYFGLSGLAGSVLFMGIFWLIFIIDGFLCAGRYNSKLALKLATGAPIKNEDLKNGERVATNCLNCLYYEYKSKLDPSEGHCKKHLRKTYASDTCESFLNKESYSQDWRVQV